ncbi:MAG: hypothetical protein NC250_00595 [Alistipes senegalensis]|nr:hypothetical protein [Bacteroides cellulosilyticus]MCM1351218.1 hypothetical protein [Alistipes senegalensis]
MRRVVSIVVVLFAAGAVLGSASLQVPSEPQAVAPAAETAGAAETPRTERRRINWKADNAGPVSPGDSVIFLVGNFAAQHNGALIACDSAVQYSERHWEFFGNVLINKNTTFVYGDRADYDGDRNEARVYSDLIKVVDGDATLYTYTFVYNTRTNVGEFAGGGILTNGENRLESQRGYYFGDDKLLASVDDVQMRNEEYALKGDSVVYDLATDNALFFDRTNIWNRDGEYLYADRGSYSKADTAYFVTRNGYLLTERQELWSDSLDYFRPQGHAVLRCDLQIDDTEHKILAFGDFGEYWREPGDAFLTRRPAVISYDTSQGDSIYMRSDSMFLYTVNRLAEARRVRAAAVADSLARVQALADSLAGVQAAPEGRSGDADEDPADERASERETVLPDSLATDDFRSAPDSLAGAAVAADTMRVIDPLDTLTGEARKAYLKAQKLRERAARKAAADAVKKAKLDTAVARCKAKTALKLDAEKAREARKAEVRREKARLKLDAARARAARKGKAFGKVDSAVLARLDSLAERVAFETDSLSGRMLDSLLAAQRAAVQQLADTTAQLPLDSIYRLIKGYRDVRIYRSDFQAVCDSIVGFSTDSTLHLYIDPVFWNQNNQITSDSVTVFTERQQIARAEFFGNPVMSSELDTTYYNQITGKTMTAYFRDNQIYRNDVVGNAQTIYYMTDGEPPVVVTMGVIVSGDISFYFEERELVQMTWRANPDYQFYPIFPDYQVPDDQPLYLKGFHWEGARRPSRRDVFDRIVRPSERAARLRLAQPDFPIMQRIEAYKEELTASGRWIDRNDPVDQQTVEWMHDLGYEVGQPYPRPQAEQTEPSAPEL